jgi:hypothetical protein
VLVTVVLVALVVGMCLVSLASIGAVVWMRTREQKRDDVLQSAEALAQLDEALDDALKELNKVGNLVQKEIGEKYQSMLFLYNLLEEKQKEQGELPQKIAVDLARVLPHMAQMPVLEKIEAPEPVPVAPVPVAPVPVKKKKAEVKTVTKLEPAAEKPEIETVADTVSTSERPAVEVAAKPAPRKRAANPKHKKVRDLHEQGISVADIAKELGIGQGEITLILEMAGKR